jgi:hypothetical protein
MKYILMLLVMLSMSLVACEKKDDAADAKPAADAPAAEEKKDDAPAAPAAEEKKDGEAAEKDGDEPESQPAE